MTQNSNPADNDPNAAGQPRYGQYGTPQPYGESAPAEQSSYGQSSYGQSSSDQSSNEQSSAFASPQSYEQPGGSDASGSSYDASQAPAQSYDSGQSYASGQSYESGQPQAYAASPGYDQPGYVTPTKPTNTLALVSMILSLVGLLSGITAIGGVICGHIARKQIKETGEGGSGMALTGLIVGYAVIAFMVIGIVIWIIAFAFLMSQEPSYESYNLLGI